MNEQIEAYLKQHHCRDYFNSYGETVEDDHYFMYREEVDGLIELIVKETLLQIQALAQPEQKPVAIVNEGMGGIEWFSSPLPDDTALYAAPPKREWVGLTDDEIDDCFFQRLKQDGAGWRLNDVIRAVEAKLEEKNT